MDVNQTRALSVQYPSTGTAPTASTTALPMLRAMRMTRHFWMAWMHMHMRLVLAATRHTACNATRVGQLSQQSFGSASQLAHAYLANCGNTSENWSPDDAQRYFDVAWQVDPLACGATRSHGGTRGDGQYSICADRALAQGMPCHVVSVGLNDDTSFEESLHQGWPECAIHGYDGSLTGSRASLAAKLPGFLRFHPTYFNQSSWREHVDAPAGVRLLKVDCEDCEWRGTLHPNAWLEHICTDQIILELHRGKRGRGPCQVNPKRGGVHLRTQVQRMHTLFTALDVHYRVFWRGSNPRHAGCSLFGLVRRTPCGLPRPGRSV